MNYLTKRDARDKLVEEITEYILSRVPETRGAFMRIYLTVLARHCTDFTASS